MSKVDYISPILGVVSNKIEMISKIWEIMGIDNDKLKIRFNSLSSHLFIMLDEMYKEELAAKQALIDSIEDLKLGLDLLAPEDSRLVYFDKMLYDQYKFLSERAKAVLEQYKYLKEEENVLCLRLNEESTEQIFKYAPNQDQMNVLKEHVDMLTLEKRNRLSVLSKIRNDIITFSNLVVADGFNDPSLRNILDNDALEKLPLSLTFLDEVEKLCNNLKNDYINLKGKCDNLKEAIVDLRSRLELPDDEVLDLNKTICLAFFNQLRLEFNRLNQMKLDNLPNVILNCRTEVVHWWNNCMLSDNERQLKEELFSSFQDTDERLLIALEDEIAKCKSFYFEHKEIFEAVETWRSLFSKFRIVEQKMKDPVVLKNRGGILLAVEKELKQLRRDSTRQLNTIRNLTNSCRQLTVFGLSPMDYVEFERNEYEEEKENQKQSKLLKSATPKSGQKRRLNFNKSDLTHSCQSNDSLLKKARLGLSTSNLTSAMNSLSRSYLSCSKAPETPTTNNHSIKLKYPAASENLAKTPLQQLYKVSTPKSTTKVAQRSSPALTNSAKLLRSVKKCDDSMSTPHRLVRNRIAQAPFDTFRSPMGTAPKSAVKPQRMTSTPRPSRVG